MPDAPMSRGILLLSSLTAWRKIKSRPLGLFLFAIRTAVLKILTYYVKRSGFARWSAPVTGFNNTPGGRALYPTH